MRSKSWAGLRREARRRLARRTEQKKIQDQSVLTNQALAKQAEVQTRLNRVIAEGQNLNTLAALAYGGSKLSEALRAGDLKIEGDKSVVKRFLTLFPMPKPAPS